MSSGAHMSVIDTDIFFVKGRKRNHCRKGLNFCRMDPHRKWPRYAYDHQATCAWFTLRSAEPGRVAAVTRQLLVFVIIWWRGLLRLSSGSPHLQLSSVVAKLWSNIVICKPNYYIVKTWARLFEAAHVVWYRELMLEANCSNEFLMLMLDHVECVFIKSL